MIEETKKTKKKSKEIKIAGSSLRVLELLKALAQQPLSTSDLLRIIEEKDEKLFRKEIVNKYLNTLKLLGLKIKKIDRKYTLLTNIEKIDLSKTDLSLLKFIEKYTQKINSPIFSKNISDILNILELSFSKNTKNLIENNEIHTYRLSKKTNIKSEDLSIFEKYCKDTQKLDIIYKPDGKSQKEFYKVAPVKILHKKGNAVLVAYDVANSTYKEFLIKFISEVKQTPQKSSNDYPSTVTFRLKNRLAKSYVLKNGEKLLDVEDNSIIIANQKEDRNLLIRRLSRYFDQCEILYPKECREMMLDYLSSIENIYK